ncbi:DUF922 domain-containing protein [Tamlana sp. 2201CG12-4]|uniref:DUF922 domain-containing protein n=1 Tax=Tamlana sp. 2201CG12-4 TaxID=3112582 RepID=UPI002DBDD766|nr:DUF922 domain-containing protein [Tamlana sp. 2201CG12-4]MEC3907426.1 DUF922 domain-containing protein [Tamlana sp. 2201CG12-4]
MIRTILILLYLISFQKDQPVLAWNESYKLSWTDFKAKPDDSQSAVAVTASGITFGFSIKQNSKNRVVGFTSNVFAHFYPEQSWYKPGQADTHVLGHEQLHFDITELFVRKFRYRISKLKASNSVSDELKKIHKSILKELSEFQDQYDNETNYSRNFETQVKWEVYVLQELQKLSKYKSLN